MVSKVAVGGAAGGEVQQEGSIGRCQGKVSKTTAEIPGHQINLNRSISKGLNPSNFPFFKVKLKSGGE